MDDVLQELEVLETRNEKASLGLRFCITKVKQLGTNELKQKLATQLRANPPAQLVEVDPSTKPQLLYDLRRAAEQMRMSLHKSESSFRIVVKLIKHSEIPALTDSLASGMAALSSRQVVTKVAKEWRRKVSEYRLSGADQGESSPASSEEAPGGDFAEAYDPGDTAAAAAGRAGDFAEAYDPGEEEPPADFAEAYDPGGVAEPKLTNVDSNLLMCPACEQSFFSKEDLLFHLNSVGCDVALRMDAEAKEREAKQQAKKKDSLAVVKGGLSSSLKKVKKMARRGSSSSGGQPAVDETHEFTISGPVDVEHVQSAPVSPRPKILAPKAAAKAPRRKRSGSKSRKRGSRRGKGPRKGSKRGSKRASSRGASKTSSSSSSGNGRTRAKRKKKRRRKKKKAKPAPRNIPQSVVIKIGEMSVEAAVISQEFSESNAQCRLKFVAGPHSRSTGSLLLGGDKIDCSKLMKDVVRFPYADGLELVVELLGKKEKDNNVKDILRKKVCLGLTKGVRCAQFVAQTEHEIEIFHKTAHTSVVAKVKLNVTVEDETDFVAMAKSRMGRRMRSDEREKMHSVMSAFKLSEKVNNMLMDDEPEEYTKADLYTGDDPVRRAADQWPVDFDTIGNAIVDSKLDMDDVFTNWKEQNILHIVCMYGSEALVSMVAKHGTAAKPHEIVGVNASIEQVEAVKNNATASKKRTYDIRAVDEAGISPFAYAVIFGNLEALTALYKIEPGLIHSEVFGLHGIHIAAGAGELEIVDFFLTEGVSPDLKDINGATPLFYASYGGYLDIVKLLVERGCLPSAEDTQCVSPLLMALEGKQPETAIYLLEKGADRNAYNTRGDNGLWLSLYHGLPGVFQTMIKSSIKLNTPLEKHEHTLLQKCVLMIDDEAQCALSIGALLAHGAAVDARNATGKTALFLAAALCKVRVVRMLVQSGANVEHRDAHGNTALHFCGHPTIAEILCQHKREALINAQNSDGDTPLHIAYAFGNLELVSCLRGLGARESLQNSKGWGASEGGMLPQSMKYLPFFAEDENEGGQSGIVLVGQTAKEGVGRTLASAKNLARRGGHETKKLFKKGVKGLTGAVNRIEGKLKDRNSRSK